jgi:hypothetical protein
MDAGESHTTASGLASFLWLRRSAKAIASPRHLRHGWVADGSASYRPLKFQINDFIYAKPT